MTLTPMRAKVTSPTRNSRGVGRSGDLMLNAPKTRSGGGRKPSIEPSAVSATLVGVQSTSNETASVPTMRHRLRQVHAQAHHLNTGRSTSRACSDHSSITAPMVMNDWITAIVGMLCMRRPASPADSLLDCARTARGSCARESVSPTDCCLVQSQPLDGPDRPILDGCGLGDPNDTGAHGRERN